MKTILVTLIALTALASASCRKTRTCTCDFEQSYVATTRYPGTSMPNQVSTGSQKDTYTSEAKKARKKSFADRSDCYSRTETSTNVSTGSNGSTNYETTTDYTTTYNCKLK